MAFPPLADLLIYRDLILAGQARRRIPDAPPQQVLAPIAAAKASGAAIARAKADVDVERNPVIRKASSGQVT